MKVNVIGTDQVLDVEARLSKTEGANNEFGVAIEVIEFSPDDGGMFTADKSHNHSEEFSADTCEEAMDIFTNLLNAIAMPLLEWSRDESLSEATKPIETKPDD